VPTGEKECHGKAGNLFGCMTAKATGTWSVLQKTLMT
jgi:hypothetical protein